MIIGKKCGFFFINSEFLDQNTVEFWGSIIGQEIFAQNCGFIVGKGVKIMISEG